MSNRNITLSLPEDDLKRARIMAARRGTSISRLLAETLRDLVDQDSGYAHARDRSLDLLKSAPELGTEGHIAWSREELHER